MTSRRPRDVVRELERSPYFRGIPETLLHPLAVHAELARVSDGLVFAAHGSPPDGLYVVLSGKVDVLRRTPKSDELTKVSELQPGMLVGHVSALRDKPRQASYRAQGTVDLLKFPADAVKRLLDDEGVVGSAFRRALIMALSNHLLAANKKLTTFIGDGKPRTPKETEGMLQDLHDTLSGVDEPSAVSHPPSARDDRR
jgi:CRP-like cAMP-binding protein